MASWRNAIKSIIKTGVSEVSFKEPLKKHTTYRIGGNAECFTVINDYEDLSNLVKYAKSNKIPVFVIGNGSKLLIPSQGLTGITIKLGSYFNNISRNNNELKIGAATPISKVVQFALRESLSGVEFLCGIPATFGGAVKCNAGAFSKEIGNCVGKIFGISSNGQKIVLLRNNMKFAYRQSNLPEGFIITEGIIELTPHNKDNIKELQNKYQKIRKKNQPWGASVGSIFKNPINSIMQQIPAGKLIDEVNLKGLKCGDAIISTKHANFIINKKNAHSNDVYELIQIIKSKVELKFNVILQEEVQILPKFMEVKKWQNQNELSV